MYKSLTENNFAFYKAITNDKTKTNKQKTNLDPSRTVCYRYNSLSATQKLDLPVMLRQVFTSNFGEEISIASDKNWRILVN